MIINLLFGDGCEKVNTNRLAELVGCAPSTLREWRAGNYPSALRIFARICKIRKLKDDQILALIRELGRW